MSRPTALTHHYRGEVGHRLTRVGEGFRSLTALVMAGVIGTSSIASASVPGDPLLTAHAMEYQAYRNPARAELPVNAGAPLSLQVEGDGIYLRNFAQNTNNVFKAAATRHGQAAAEIMKEAADDILRATGHGANIAFIDTPLLYTGISANLSRVDQQVIDAALAHTAVISISENGATFLPDNPDNTAEELRRSPTLIVEAAGNYFANALRRQDINPLAASTILRIGAARGHVLADYSACNTSVDEVAANPFDVGFKYKYYRTAAELKKDALHYAQMDLNLDQIKQIKYNNFIQSTQKSLLDDYADDMGRLVSNMDGTSFSTPNVGGQAAAIRQLYPQLGKTDVMVAALLAARADQLPTYQGNVDEHRHPLRLVYQTTARGLKFNPECAGFGLETAGRFAANARHMTEMLKHDASLATQTVYLGGDQWQQSAPGTYWLQLDQKATAIRVRINATFDAPPLDKQGRPLSKVPGTITLISPDGTDIKISPGMCPQNQFLQHYGAGTTTGFLGSPTAGKWQVIAPPSYQIHGLTFSIDAVKPGGLIDKIIDETTAKTAAKHVTAIEARHSKPQRLKPW